MRYARYLLVFTLSLCIAHGAFAGAKPKAKAAPKAKAEEAAPITEIPWALRDHYTVTLDKTSILYAADNGQWNLELSDIGTILEKVDSSITFGDGKVVLLRDMGKGDTTRANNTEELGVGMEYVVAMPEIQGIQVRHSLTHHKEHPFYAFRIHVKNTSQQPIDIKKISSGIIGPGSFKKVIEPQVSLRPLSYIGQSAVVSKDSDPLYAVISDRAKGFSFAIGSLPTGKGESGTTLQPYSGSWQGEIATTFNPPVHLEPGQTVSADPMWISFSLAKPADIDLYFGWAIANLQGTKFNPKVPRAWVTVADGSSAADLQAAATDWASAGIGAALVPGTWEGRPGSLDGAAPEWPRDMKSLASTLRQAGMTPGITVDPLSVDGGGNSWTAQSDDARRWINPTNEAARAYAVAQMKKLTEWGYGFYVVESTHTPDEVLITFGLSRAAANHYAYKIMMEAAGSAPVYAASRATLGADKNDWLSAAAATCRLQEYNALTGAVRFDGSAVEKLDDETLAAIALCGAPIEVIGRPSRGVVNDFARVFPKSGMRVRAIDAEMQAPALWQVQILAGERNPASLAIVSFENARAHEAADLQSMNGETVETVWHSEAKDFVNAMRKPVPESSKLNK